MSRNEDNYLIVLHLVSGQYVMGVFESNSFNEYTLSDVAVLDPVNSYQLRFYMDCIDTRHETFRFRYDHIINIVEHDDLDPVLVENYNRTVDRRL